MAIRIRQINGKTITLCAALSKPKEGDIYLEDTIHHALSTKFGCDWQAEGFLKENLADQELMGLMFIEQGGKLT